MERLILIYSLQVGVRNWEADWSGSWWRLGMVESMWRIDRRRTGRQERDKRQNMAARIRLLEARVAAQRVKPSLGMPKSQITLLA